MDILLATNNPHKADELRQILGSELPTELAGIRILSISDVLPQGLDVEETGHTLEENAYIKARTLHDATGLPCIADDTGLEIDALDGAPGVYTARFAGANASYSDNVNLALEKLRDVPHEQRSAQFRAVICYCDDVRTFFAEGICKGHIATQALGTSGFGYDPIFIPEGSAHSFAQMDSEEKHAISHRGKALRAFVAQYHAYTV